MSTPSALMPANFFNPGIFPPTMANRMDLFQKLKSKTTVKQEGPASPNVNPMEASPQWNNWLASFFTNNPLSMPMPDVYSSLLMQGDKSGASSLTGQRSTSNGPTPAKKAHLDGMKKLSLGNDRHDHEHNGADVKPKLNEALDLNTNGRANTFDVSYASCAGEGGKKCIFPGFIHPI